mgnify:CR=1 FL=1
MKLSFAIIALLLLSGCGQWDRGVANITGWVRVCVAEVSYLQFPSGVTVEYTRDGKIKNC